MIRGLKKEIVGEVLFLLLIGGLVVLWMTVQVLSFRYQDTQHTNCRILDIELKTDDLSFPDNQLCRVTIALDQQVDYRISEPGPESPLLVLLPQADIAPELDFANLSNDLVEKVWFPHDKKGHVTVRLDLAFSNVKVIDHTEKSAAGAMLIDLELVRPVMTAQAPSAGDFEKPVRLVSLPTQTSAASGSF